MRDRHIQVAADSELLQEIRKEVKQEFHPNEQAVRVHLLLKFVVYFGLSVVFYASLFWVNAPGYFVLIYILYGLSSLLFAFNFAHDFSHETVFSNKIWNHLGFVALYTLVGAHAEEWRKRHIQSHHFAPNVKEYDSDLQITGIIRVIPESPYRWYHRFQHLYAPFAYTSYSLFWVFIKDAVIYTEGFRSDAKRNWGYHLSFWGQKAFYLGYLLLLPLLASGQHWGIVLLGFVCMHLVQSLFLLFTFFMTHHVENTYYPQTDADGQILSSWLMNQIRSSNDMHPFSRLANFILGGFNNHIAHHLFPHIHHMHYPKLSTMLYDILERNGIQPNQTSYWGGIVSHLRLLRNMGQQGSNKYLR